MWKSIILVVKTILLAWPWICLTIIGYILEKQKICQNYVYENLQNYDPTNKRRVLIAFYDMITDMESN